MNILSNKPGEGVGVLQAGCEKDQPYIDLRLV